MSCSDDPSPPPHVAFIAFPFASHVAQLHSLAQAIAAACPSSIFSFVSTAKTLESIRNSAENMRLCSYEEEIGEGGSCVALTEVVGGFLDAAQGKIRAVMKRVREDAGGIPVSCVVSDAFLWMVDSVAEEIQVPWVSFFSGFPLALLAHLYADDMLEHFQIQEKVLPANADTILDFIPGLASMRVRDLPEGIIFGNTNSKFALNLHFMAQHLSRSSALIFPTLSGLQVDSTLFPTLRLTLPIGPINLLSSPSPISDEENCLPWLDSHAGSSVIYVAFGTIFTLPPEELTELAHGLEDSGAPFLWSLKEEARPFLPEGFALRTHRRGNLVNWAPQLAVLRHPAVGLFVTHCGWNSTLESVLSGVVMLCRPIFAEQKMIARAMEAIFGVGINLDDGIRREAFKGAVHDVLNGDVGKRMRKKAAELREMTAKDVSPGGRLSENFKILVELVCRR